MTDDGDSEVSSVSAVWVTDRPIPRHRRRREVLCGQRFRLLAAGSRPLPSKIPRQLAAEVQNSTKLTNLEIKLIYLRFRRAALDGFISFSRFREMLGMLGMLDETFLAERLFKAFDLNGDGRIDFVEFTSALSVMVRGEDEDKLELSFRILNPTYRLQSTLPFMPSTPGGGRPHVPIAREVLTLEEFIFVVRSLYVTRMQLVGETPDPIETSTFERLFETLGGRVAGELVMDFEQFKKAVRDSPDFLAALGITSVCADFDAGVRRLSHDRPTTVLIANRKAPPNRQIVSVPNSRTPSVEGPLTSFVELQERLATLGIDATAIGEKFRRQREKNSRTPKPNVTIFDMQTASQGAEDLSSDSEISFSPILREIEKLENDICDLGLMFRKSTSVQPRRTKSEFQRRLTARANADPIWEVNSRASAWEGSKLFFMNKPDFGQLRLANRENAATVRRFTGRRRVEHKLLGVSGGFAVHFGHESWNMVLNMMVGMRIAAGRISLEPRRRVELYDFWMREKFSIVPRAAVYVNKATEDLPEAVRFIDFAPMVFRKLREKFGLSSLEYLRSVGPEQLVGNMVLGNLASLSELCSEGKSGSFFYYTADGRFLIKTITKEAAAFLSRILPDYFDHMSRYPDSLISLILGFHAIRLKQKSANVSRKLFFLVMGNVFHTPAEIHRRYDIKGSWVGRLSESSDGGRVTLKDQNLVISDDKIKIGRQNRKLLMRTLRRDATFFKRHEILDYSLLVGIHYFDHPDSSNSNPSVTWCVDTDDDAAAPFHQNFRGGMQSTDRTCVYYLGIIDFLTNWTSHKRFEHLLRVSCLLQEGAGVSCVHPTLYADRFLTFLAANVV